jgi:hypothetical protein
VRIGRTLVVLREAVAEHHAATATLVERGLQLRDHFELGRVQRLEAGHRDVWD